MRLKQILKKIIPVSKFDYRNLKDDYQNLKEELESLKREFEFFKDEQKNEYERIDVKFTDIIRKSAEKYQNE